MRRMLHLKALSAVLGQILVVRHMRHQVGYVGVESLYQFRMRDLLVFDRVVQSTGSYEVRVSHRLQSRHTGLPNAYRRG